MARMATAAVFLVFAAILLGGGAWLIAAGDSWAAGTLGWALWEVGLDWWQLAPRGWVVAAAGAWLLVPWIVFSLDRGGPPRWTPMSRLGDDGRQYVVAVAGGHGSLGAKAGDAVIAYRLP